MKTDTTAAQTRPSQKELDQPLTDKNLCVDIVQMWLLFSSSLLCLWGRHGLTLCTPLIFEPIHRLVHLSLKYNWQIWDWFWSSHLTSRCLTAHYLLLLDSENHIVPLLTTKRSKFSSSDVTKLTGDSRRCHSSRVFTCPHSPEKRCNQPNQVKKTPVEGVPRFCREFGLLRNSRRHLL